jgi:hypothetical protein
MIDYEIRICIGDERIGEYYLILELVSLAEDEVELYLLEGRQAHHRVR